jgi:hypothetical protein
VRGDGRGVSDAQAWPPLPLAEWQASYETVHLWTQIVGKIRLAMTPLINHWWNATLFVNARGLTTSAMPYRESAFEIAFDFIDHRLLIEAAWGPRTALDLRPQPCADFYAGLMTTLKEMEIDTHIWPVTVEMPTAVRLDEDRAHTTYDPEYVQRWWLITLKVAMILQEFRGRFIGKHSPVHFFWGSFDLASTRFSGRRAPERPGADAMTREAYSHEVWSGGFWPGSGPIQDAAFYAYAAPQPDGFDRRSPGYNRELGESILMYDEMRNSASPRDTLLDFLQASYEAAATLGKWNRAELER